VGFGEGARIVDDERVIPVRDVQILATDRGRDHSLLASPCFRAPSVWFHRSNAVAYEQHILIQVRADAGNGVGENNVVRRVRSTYMDAPVMPSAFSVLSCR